MNILNKKKYLIVIAMLLFSNFSIGEININFGIYTSEKPTALVLQFRPILNVLEKAISVELNEKVKIHIQVSKTYEEGIAKLANGKIDFARLGPASYISAKKINPNIEILAMENNKGKKVFNGIICIPSDSNISSIKDLKSKSFAFGNKESTIGRYLSQLLLFENGIKASDLSNYKYLGRHDKVGTAVGMKQFDAGALKESTFKKLVLKGVKIKKLISFLNVTKPWIVNDKVNKKLKLALKTALLKMKDKKALKNLKRIGFLEGDDSEYDTIRKSIKKNKHFFE